MIRRIQDESRLLSWAEDPIGLRACAAAAAYGLDGHICQFWLQNEETRARILHQQEKLEEEQAKSAADS